MFLRPPSCVDDALRAASSGAASSSSSSSSPMRAQAPIVDLVVSLTNQRLYREVSLSVRTGLRDASAEFSFMRVRGLRSLTKFLASAVKSEKIVEQFQETQTYRELQVAPVLFENTLAPSERDANHPHVGSAPSGVEIGLALRVLEGCCLLDAGSRLIASRYAATKVVMALLLNCEPADKIACLDALLAVLLDSPPNQKEFERIQGVQKIAELVKSPSVDDGVRLKCAEFLLFLVSHVLPARARPVNGFQQEEGREGGLAFEGARQDIVEILGRKSNAVLDAMPAKEVGISDFESEETTLRKLSHKLVNSC